MRRLILLVAAVLPLVAFTAEEADAQRRGWQPGIQGDGFRSPGVRSGGRYRPAAVRPGGQFRPVRWRPVRTYPRRWGRPVYYSRRWGRPVYYRRNTNWGWGVAGLATGVAIGAAAAQSAPVFATPIRSSIGGYCATPMRTCALINPAPVGTGCSCRVPGGRARGSVVGP